MKYDFDTPINRRNTFSFKWDCDMDYFGSMLIHFVPEESAK